MTKGHNASPKKGTRWLLVATFGAFTAATAAVNAARAPSERMTIAPGQGTVYKFVIPPQGVACGIARSKPSFDSDEVGRILRGERVTVIAKTSDGRWLRIKHASIGEGWMHRDVLGDSPPERTVVIRRYTCTQGTPEEARGGCMCGNDIVNLCGCPDPNAPCSPSFEIVGNTCVFRCSE